MAKINTTIRLTNNEIDDLQSAIECFKDKYDTTDYSIDFRKLIEKLERGRLRNLKAQKVVSDIYNKAYVK